jgi:hypothetical protein
MSRTLWFPILLPSFDSVCPDTSTSHSPTLFWPCMSRTLWFPFLLLLLSLPQLWQLVFSSPPPLSIYIPQSILGKWVHSQQFGNDSLSPLVTMQLTNSWNFLQEPSATQLLRNFIMFYRNQRFITTFIRALHWSLSWATSNQSIPIVSISVRFIFILFSPLHLHILSGLFPSDFPPKAPTHSSSSPCYMPCPTSACALLNNRTARKCIYCSGNED